MPPRSRAERIRLELVLLVQVLVLALVLALVLVASTGTITYLFLRDSLGFFNPQKLPLIEHFEIQDFVKMWYSRVLHFDEILYFEVLD